MHRDSFGSGSVESSKKWSSSSLLKLKDTMMNIESIVVAF